jgi:hypothetical protein
MSIKIEQIPGASKGDKGSFFDTQRRVMSCDQPSCSGKLEGNAGSSEDALKQQAFSMGWHRHPHTSKDRCPSCAAGKKG